jgi:NAD(P)-dependent dehydrogenase (short-subunit alcohol dehydrogenase family)
MAEINGKVALVTGAGSGIGRGVVMALAKAGAKVVVADILKETAEKVAAEIKAAGGTALAVQCDVCDREAVKRMKAEANKAFGTVSIVFANAGATSFDRFTEMSHADIDWIIPVNLMGVTYCMEAFIPDMIAAKEGHVAATASMAGLLPGWIANHVPYSAAKMGIIGMMFNLRMELAEHNVGTTVYCPGGVATGMKQNNAKYRPAKFGGPGQGEVHIDEASSHVTKLNFLTPETIAKLVLLAIKENRPVVVDHSDQRKHFVETYVNPVMKAFDQAADFEKAEGIKAG